MRENRAPLPILDRLLKPPHSGDAVMRRTGTIEELKASVRRDLDFLLNTRRPKSEAPPTKRQKGSVLEYGLPDFASYGLSFEEAQTELAMDLERAIRDFEPRLTNVSITPLSDGGRLTFRVRADLRVEPAREFVQFQAVLEPGSGRFDMGEIKRYG